MILIYMQKLCLDFQIMLWYILDVMFMNVVTLKVDIHLIYKIMDSASNVHNYIAKIQQ